MKNVNQKVAEILTDNGLDFNITKAPLVALVNGNEVKSPYYGLINDKTGEVINTCKAGYHVSQNQDVVEMVVRGIEPFGDKLNIQKAGSLNGGRKVFLQIGIDGIGSVNGDTIKKYITIIDSNDGSTGLSVGVGDLTMSCANQFYRFYKAGEFKFRHTATIENKIQTLPSLVQRALSESLKQIEIYNKFESTKVTRELADKLVKHLLGHDRSDKGLTSKSISHMESLYSHIQRETAQKGLNLWGLHSGVTSWTTHKKNAPKRENGRIESLMTSTNYRTNLNSFEFALEQIGGTINKQGLILV